MEVQRAHHSNGNAQSNAGRLFDAKPGLGLEEGTLFPLEKYVRASGATRPEAFDWSDPGPQLDEEALFCVGHMMDIEAHTIINLRELLSTRVAEDPQITAFMTCWNYEEFFHSEVLKTFLSCQHISIDERRFASLRRATPASHLIRMGARLVSLMTSHFPAVHMTWGAITELTAIESYRALAERTQHALLGTILEAIIKDERRHFSFYFNQARIRLRSPAAQALTTAILKNFWAPVGSRFRGEAPTRRVQNYLYTTASARSRLAELDSTIARLPGLGWFNLVARY